jgi:hypothetical protein
MLALPLRPRYGRTASTTIATITKTGAPCNATVGSNLWADGGPMQGTAMQTPYYTAVKLLQKSTTVLMYNESTVSAWFVYKPLCKGASRGE